MASIKAYNPQTGKWEVQATSLSSEMNVMDLEDNFESDNVEGCLRELADKIVRNEGLNGLDVKVEKNTQEIKRVSNEVSKLNDDVNIVSNDLTSVSLDFSDLKDQFIEHTTNHPGGEGGGGGGTMPTIKSNFSDTSIESDKELVIPIFYTSPNLGDGTCFIVVNGIEIGSQTVKQGNNNITVGILPALSNVIQLYVRDRAGLLSNQLEWTIVKGGVELEVLFDSDADYAIDDVIRMIYNVDAAGTDPKYLNLTINYDELKIECKNGYNEYIFKGLGVGVHKVSLYVSCGEYKSKTFKFNIVVVNSENLYVTSTFEPGSYEYGIPLQVPYRVSKLSSEEFTINLYIDNVVNKTLKAPAGSYVWTISEIDIGPHTLKIEALGSQGDQSSIEIPISIELGDYTPVKPVETGLVAWFDATGKTNNDENKDVWIDRSGNGNRAYLHNFNYFTNGWVNDSLICDSNAYVEIPLTPYKDNVKLGSTIDIYYKIHNIGIEDARILDYTDIEVPYKGIYINVIQTELKSLTSTGKVSLDEEEELHVTYVIDRFNKFGKIYVNGVMCRAFYLSDSGSGVDKFYEDFTHNQKIYLNSEKGIKNFGSCEIKQFRIYDRALDDKEVLQNYMADIHDLRRQEKIYKFNYENKLTPEIRMYGNFENMTDTQKVSIRIKYNSPNEDLYGSSFDLPYCEGTWQGTSSLQYVLKNYTIYLRDENLNDFFYTPYKNGIKEKVFCLKADYMESSHANNVGMAKFINECVYDTKNPAQLKNPNYRNSITGFPVLVYINDEIQGVYNFNLDRFSDNSYGYKETKECLCYEVSANSDTTAGAFHKWTPESGKSERDYYASDLEIIYPPSRAGIDDFREIKRLIEFVSDASDELFRNSVQDYFNLEYLIRYYLTVMVVGGVDSLGKNMKLSTWDGRIWYPQFYDLDTCLGLDNTGFLKFDMDIEIATGYFNTSNSKLWEKLRTSFDAEIKAQYALMRKDRFTVENVMKYLEGEQVSKIPQVYYNLDMQTKYLNFGPSYLYACHGDRFQHMKRWIRERIVYMDTLLEYTGSTSDFITIRANKLGRVYLDMETYIPMYLRIKFRDEENNAGTIVKRVARNEKVRFDYEIPTGTDQEIIIYGANYIKNLGDLSNLRPTTMLIANATKLTSIKCTSDRLISTDVSNCKLLQHIDLRDCTILGSGTQNTLTVSECRYLKTLNVKGTALTAVYTSLQGGNLEEIYYPTTIQSVNLVKQPNLKILGLPFSETEECSNLAVVEIIDCPNIERLSADILPDSNNTFASLKYVQRLSLRNSLKLKRMSFDGFNKLSSVKLENLYDLEECGFNNMNNEGDTGTLNSIIISNCPKIVDFTMNVTDPTKQIIFANNALIDLTNAYSITNISSNASIKGLKTIVLPKNIENILFSRQHGDGISDIKNLWSYDSYVEHKTDGYEGIDFSKLNVKNLDLTTCIYIPKAINFSAKPTDTIIFSKYRDSYDRPPILVEGSIDLTEYIGSYVAMFKFMDLSKFEIICNKVEISQSNFSYMFYQTKLLTNKDNVLQFISKLTNANVLDFLFAESDLDRVVNIVSRVNYSANYMYENCINILNLDGVEINDKCISAEGMFKKCTGVKTANNMIINVIGNVPEFFKDCTSMTSASVSNPGAVGKLINLHAMFNGCSELVNLDVSNLDVSNVNTLYGTFDGCRKLRVINLSTWDMSNVQNISTIFQGCSSLIELDFSGKNLSKVNTASYAFHFCEQLRRILFTECSFDNLTNIYCMFRMAGLREIIDFVIPDTVNNWSECFSGCPLENTSGLTINANILGGENGIFSKNSSIVNISDITVDRTIKNFNSAFKQCTSLIKDIRIPSHVNNAVDMYYGCRSLIDVTSNWNNVYDDSIIATDCYKGCTAIERIDGVYAGLEDIPSSWGGLGIMSIFRAEDILKLPDNSNSIEPGLLYMPIELKCKLTDAQIESIIEKNWTLI